MPGSPLLAARLNYQRAAVNGIDMAQSGRGPIEPGAPLPPPPGRRASPSEGREGTRARLSPGRLFDLGKTFQLEE